MEEVARSELLVVLHFTDSGNLNWYWIQVKALKLLIMGL